VLTGERRWRGERESERGGERGAREGERDFV